MTAPAIATFHLAVTWDPQREVGSWQATQVHPHNETLSGVVRAATLVEAYATAALYIIGRNPEGLHYRFCTPHIPTHHSGDPKVGVPTEITDATWMVGHAALIRRGTAEFRLRPSRTYIKPPAPTDEPDITVIATDAGYRPDTERSLIGWMSTNPNATVTVREVLAGSSAHAEALAVEAAVSDQAEGSSIRIETDCQTIAGVWLRVQNNPADRRQSAVRRTLGRVAADAAERNLDVTVAWVRGHAGHAANEQVDAAVSLREPAVVGTATIRNSYL